MSVVRERMSDRLTRERLALEVRRARGPFAVWSGIDPGNLPAATLDHRVRPRQVQSRERRTGTRGERGHPGGPESRSAIPGSACGAQSNGSFHKAVESLC